MMCNGTVSFWPMIMDYMQYVIVYKENACSFELFKTSVKYFLMYTDNTLVPLHCTLRHVNPNKSIF